MQAGHVVTAVLIAVFGNQAAAAAQRSLGQPSARPNVVLVMMDDLGYGDLGSYGAPDVRTPNIDRLARAGVRLTDAYANGHVCSPTRAALMSGRYPQRVGIEKALADAADSAVGLPVTGTSLPALLKSNGYATGLVGKWHLGWKREFSPQSHGFDEFFGFLSGAHDYYVGTVIEDTTRVQLSGYLTDEITSRALRFIEKHSTAPFFLEVAYNAVHWPFQPPDRPPTADERRAPRRRLVQLPDDSVVATRADYVKMLERADEGVGKILAALEQRSLTRNTLVIFTNDNGGEWLSRNAPFFHRKATLWEGGIRVPLILRWPAVLPAGQTSRQVALTMDLTASILAATGTKAPDSYRPDGVNILPALRGESPVLERNVFWRIDQPVRRQRAVRSGRWKLLLDGGQLFLFDLDTDPGERRDLAAQRPDKVAALRKLYLAWTNDVSSPATAR